jgi:hypothetical protein
MHRQQLRRLLRGRRSPALILPRPSLTACPTTMVSGADRDESASAAMASPSIVPVLFDRIHWHHGRWLNHGDWCAQGTWRAAASTLTSCRWAPRLLPSSLYVASLVLTHKPHTCAFFMPHLCSWVRRPAACLKPSRAASPSNNYASRLYKDRLSANWEVKAQLMFA